MNKFIFLAILFVGRADLLGCLWIHGTTISGHYETREGRLTADYLNHIKDRDVTQIRSLFQDYNYSSNNPVGKANDMAVQTLLRGDAKKAVEMLEAVEKQSPGEYYTAANLGTAYELAGDDTKALSWIQEGIRRNPQSHMLTEWLHARILETKLNQKTQPDWLSKNTITQIDFSRLSEPDYKIPSAQGMQTMAEVRGSLYEQLSVRMLLVKPKDDIVARLLFELAHLEHVLGFQETVLELLDLAVGYGLPEPAITELKDKASALTRLTWMQRWQKQTLPRLIPHIITVSLLAAFVLTIIKGYRSRSSLLSKAR